jgi:hypothetical protein
MIAPMLEPYTSAGPATNSRSVAASATCSSTDVVCQPGLRALREFARRSYVITVWFVARSSARAPNCEPSPGNPGTSRIGGPSPWISWCNSIADTVLLAISSSSLRPRE